MELVEKVIPEPVITYKPSSPFEAKILENKRLTEEKSEDDVRHLVIDISGSKISYLEGQSIGIKAISSDPNQKVPIRLYSIASAREGDDGFSTSVSLCIKRVLFKDPETGEMIKGFTSNYICDLKKGDSILITGPIGRKLLLPKDKTINLIMVAVGTGIAPFRAFIKHIYKEAGSWEGKCRLFYGSKSGMESLYMNDENNDIGQYYTKDTFEAYKALSQEDKTKDGKSIYVQHRLEENEKEIWEMIKENNFCLYICGIKALEKGIDDVFTKWAKNEGLDWLTIKDNLKKEGRWNSEVY